jgi:hypothetical protein
MLLPTRGGMRGGQGGGVRRRGEQVLWFGGWTAALYLTALAFALHNRGAVAPAAASALAVVVLLVWCLRTAWEAATR